MPNNIKHLLEKKGISLVLNMKQKYLKQISQCTGATVTSLSEYFKDPELKSCQLFHMETVVEGHNNAGSKESSSTLIYLEGLPRPLGCTILLKGASIEELKKVKHVLRYAVSAAYHLITEISYFEDQKVFAPKLDPHLPSLSDEGSEILVLFRSVCTAKKLVGEDQNYRIKFYGYHDTSLGQYVKQLLHSQRDRCSTCNEAQEMHEDSYAHQNGVLTVTVKQLEHNFSGENDIWIWSRCLKCENENDYTMANPRVLMSPLTQLLSFGKYLALNLYSRSRLSKCGHQDDLTFFGVGSKVAVFSYNRVEVFTAFQPPSILEFNNPYRQGRLQEFREKVHSRGLQFFSEIGTFLQNLKATQELSKVEEIFNIEKYDFENSFDEKSDKLEDTTTELLNLNCAYWDLVLQTYVWDHRLHHMLQNKSSDEEQEEDTEKWVWDPFYELKSTCHDDISKFGDTKFFTVNEYTPTHLSSPLNDEKDPIWFSVGPGKNILLVCEKEISSIISRALALSEFKLNNHASSIGPSRDLIEDPIYSLSSDGDMRLEVTVNGLKGMYKVTCRCADSFYKLRKKCCQSEMKFIISLSRCSKWDAKGGKSGAFFAKTKDDRFIIKEIQSVELNSFLKFHKEYFKYANDSSSQTCLARILGIYKVEMKNDNQTMDLIVMENLFFGKDVSRIYDLKGAAIYSRHTSSSDSSEDLEKVFLDQNFVNDSKLSPFYVDMNTKRLLERAIWNDTYFLSSICVMDYSVLVGVDKKRHELVFGLIDYLREYTIDKRAETVYKSVISLAGKSGYKAPTVIPSNDYKDRLREFLTKYFVTIPDSSGSPSSPSSSLRPGVFGP